MHGAKQRWWPPEGEDPVTKSSSSTFPLIKGSLPQFSVIELREPVEVTVKRVNSCAPATTTAASLDQAVCSEGKSQGSCIKIIF